MATKSMSNADLAKHVIAKIREDESDNGYIVSFKGQLAKGGMLSARQLNVAFRILCLGEDLQPGMSVSRSQDPDRQVMARCVYSSLADRKVKDEDGKTTTIKVRERCTETVSGTAREVGSRGTRCEKHQQ